MLTQTPPPTAPRGSSQLPNRKVLSSPNSQYSLPPNPLGKYSLTFPTEKHLTQVSAFTPPNTPQRSTRSLSQQKSTHLTHVSVLTPPMPHREVLTHASTAKYSLAEHARTMVKILRQAWPFLVIKKVKTTQRMSTSRMANVV